MRGHCGANEHKLASMELIKEDIFVSVEPIMDDIFVILSLANTHYVLSFLMSKQRRKKSEPCSIWHPIIFKVICKKRRRLISKAAR